MVAELKGAGQSPPLTPLLPPVSPVSLTTHTPGLKLPAPYYRPTGKHLWDPDQATQQQLCHWSMTYTKPDSEWTETLCWKCRGNPSGEETKRRESAHPRPPKERTDHHTR